MACFHFVALIAFDSNYSSQLSTPDMMVVLVALPDIIPIHGVSKEGAYFLRSNAADLIKLSCLALKQRIISLSGSVAGGTWGFLKIVLEIGC